MTKFKLSQQDNVRGHKAALVAALTAMVLVALAFFLLMKKDSISVIVPYSPAAGLGTWLSVRFFWKRLIRKGENQQRGALYGGLAGFCALFLMSLIIVLGGFIVSLLEHGVVSPLLRMETIATMPFALLFWIYFSFIFGGFLAPIIGAVAGHFLTIDPDYKIDTPG